MAESSSAATLLTPSQALGSSSASRRKKKSNNPNNTSAAAAAAATATGNGEALSSQSQQPPKAGNRNKRRQPKGPKAGSSSSSNSNTGSKENNPTNGKGTNDANDSLANGTSTGPKNANSRRKHNGGRGNSKNKGGNTKANEPSNNSAAGEQQVGDEEAIERPQGQKKNRRNNNNNKKQRKKYPWRRFIPTGTVDPITLESLISLEYPPFALVANAPYQPVPVWPIPDKGSQEKNDQIVDIEELNRKRIAEQWGKSFGNHNGDGKDEEETKLGAASSDPSKRHYNLYDGRALAYYIVSQLQFIDPLNRRDLTREELLTLDVYLRRHGFKDLNVTEAYDAKGITISSAGAAAATAQGRADIMQQMARNLLNSLFGGHSVAAPVPARRQEQPSSLQEQYAALQHQEATQHRPRQTQRGVQSGSLNPEAAPFGDYGVYGSEGDGLMVIDDDENPGMRGGDYTATRGYQSHLAASRGGSAINPFYSASHITARHGSGVISTGNADAFPALPTASAGPAPAAPAKPAPAASSASSNSKPSAKPSKTLARITGAVKKTDPEELQRQWEAREAARKRALMANMSFGVDASIIGATQQGLLQPPSGISLEAPNADVSDEKLQRNKAFADALGVQPATVRHSINSGWARPTDATISLDEFGNELNAAIYPDSLLSQARDRMGLLLKLEKKWKAFLKDDKAASLPLNPMDKPSRAFVHHYSDFWNLKTESFDPEPRRYIHCVKMMDTYMPYPLLSDATRKWRGPSAPVLPTAPASADHALQQTAGQPSKSREIPPPPERIPLPLQPRSLAPGEQKADTRPPMVTEIRSDVDPTETRFGTLFIDRERPKMELAKRTVPLELPPFEPPGKGFDMEAELMERRARQEEKVRRAKAAQEQKRRAIEEAFASDDEEEAGDDNSSASEWEEPEALYQGSDSED